MADWEYQGVAFDGSGARLAARLSERRFGYLSAKDKRLLRDATELECDAFLTMEKKLARQAEHLRAELEIRVLRTPRLLGAPRTLGCPVPLTLAPRPGAGGSGMSGAGANVRSIRRSLHMLGFSRCGRHRDAPAFPGVGPLLARSAP